VHRSVYGECRLCSRYVKFHPRTYLCDDCWRETPGHRRRGTWKQKLKPRVNLPASAARNKLLAEAASAEVLRRLAGAKEFKPQTSAEESIEQRKLRIR
jgi:hypothetical protein